MVILRVVILIFLTAYSFSMGQYSDLNSFGTVMALSFFVFAPALYFLPSYEASSRDHENFGAIGMLNLFLGWTLIGWVVAMVWAVRKPETVIVATSPTPPAELIPLRQMKLCPFCAEEVLVAAVKCKHCGSDMPDKMIEQKSPT